MQQKRRQAGQGRQEVKRERLEVDIVIVGGGPAGLSAAIEAARLAREAGTEKNILVLEKGAEIGAHILSGAVIDPIGLRMLFPDWDSMEDRPLHQRVEQEAFFYLSEKKAHRIPGWLLPPLMHNTDAGVGSLAQLCRFLAAKAQEAGVEIYPGMAASSLVEEEGRIIGVVAGEMGKGKDGSMAAGYEPGMEICAACVMIAEGACGTLARRIVEKYHLDTDCSFPKYGLGIKELWRLDTDHFHSGHVAHYLGWPLDDATGGGGWSYQYDDGLLSLGYVVHLDYKNPYISPYQTMQKFKTHPVLRKLLDKGKRIAYGARVVSEGGWQSLPRLDFPGGMLLGCAAGMVNVPRIKGSHNAIQSGVLAARAAMERFSNKDASGLDARVRKSVIGKELKQVRNVKPLISRMGTVKGMMLSGFDMWCTTLMGGFSFFGTLRHTKEDHACCEDKAKHNPPDYPRPDGVLTFDLLTNLSFSGVNHREGEPSHITLKDKELPLGKHLALYDEPARHYCPAKVYVLAQDDADSAPQFRIDAQNCLHCKTCAIKDPSRNILWTTPEGGGGPRYGEM